MKRIVRFPAAKLAILQALGILASLLLFRFLRQRGFRAEAGGARPAGRGKTTAGLERLCAAHEPPPLPGLKPAAGTG